MAIKPIERCLACNDLVYKQVLDKSGPGTEAKDLDLIITTCGHVYDRVCLTQWLKTGSTCPVLPETDVEITLKECRKLQDSMVFLANHYEKNQATANKILKEAADKICSICHETFSSAYYIPAEKRFMHKACWFEKNSTPSESPPPEFYPQQIATFEKTIKPILPVVVTPLASPHTGLFIVAAIWIPISAWAWGMNWRYHQRSNMFLSLLSLPTLLTINTCSLFYRSLVRVFTEKPVY